ncbi:PUR family DNA/RNA-binding protein [Flavobacteriales bacterium]|nr:PUR family DNA/RNA-binding protein [Flavobacteriales bacterium]
MSDQSNREEIFSKPVRAGKRTYFFDVKATRGRDLYMTITESKRRFDDDGNVHYQKHKIFLYREDFQNFEEGFVAAVEKIDELMATGEYRDPIAEREAKYANSESNEDATAENDSDTSELPSSPESDSTEEPKTSDDISFEDL